MRKEDLHPSLQKPYAKKTGYGLEKGSTESLRNVWFVVPPPPQNDTPSGLNAGLLKEAHEVLSRLPRLDTLSNLDRLVLSLLVRREALQSSRMEGTWSTIEQVLTPGALYNKREKSARASVVGYAHALEAAFIKARKAGVKIFQLDLLRQLHRELMSHDPDFRGKPGLFRHEIGSGVYATIGGLGRPENSTYNPTPPSHLAENLEQNLDWIRDEALIEMSHAGMAPSLVIRLARSHWHFEAVHPFSDGNGRVGRMLMTLQMVAEGLAPLYLSGYIEAHKKEYVRGLQQAQMQLKEAPLIHFLCQAITASWEEAQKTKLALTTLPEQWQGRGEFRADSTARQALLYLLESPILTVKLLQTHLGVSQPAASRAITQLQAAKILRERTGMGRNRVFAAEEVIELLARPFGEPPETALETARALLTT